MYLVKIEKRYQNIQGKVNFLPTPDTQILFPKESTSGGFHSLGI